MTAATSLTGEHAEDVLNALVTWTGSGLECALVFVTGTEGGAVRSPGALLAVSPNQSTGYISGGCIDADVELQARAACAAGQARALRYGAGSPFVDLPLPCGGAIEVLIIPSPDIEVVQATHDFLRTRHNVSLIVSETGTMRLQSDHSHPSRGDYVFHYTPKLRLRIAGRGADTLALARISDASGYETRTQLVDDEDIEQAERAGIKSIEKLSSPSDLSAVTDDAWTAFVLLFHDSAWEVPLLRQALAGPAFYVGAVGSKRTHAVRCDGLKRAGCSNAEIERVRGPIGLVPSLRDASMLAISTLAEIVDAFPGKSSSRRPATAILMLAAGASSRFEAGDKLLADLNGRSVLAWSAERVPDVGYAERFAVVRSAQSERAEILRQHGWTIIENPDAERGQSTSVKRGISEISSRPEIDQVIITLGDMPFVPAVHFEALRKAADSTARTAIMTESSGTLSPPALFKRQHFEALMSLDGDQGAKSVFLQLPHGSDTCQLARDLAEDIDNLADMARVKEATHA